MTALTISPSHSPVPTDGGGGTINHHWRPRTSRTSRTLQTYTRTQLDEFYSDDSSTISPTSATPPKIARILVFDNAHPDFPREIFVKSHLDLLFDAPLSSLQTTAVPLYRQVPVAISGGRDRWEFGGWYVIDAVHRVEKCSSELTKRLEDKWSKRSRSSSPSNTWQSNVELDWAAVMLRKVSDGGCPLASLNTSSSPPPSSENGSGSANGKNEGYGSSGGGVEEQDYTPYPPPPSRVSGSPGAGDGNHTQEEFFITPHPPPPTRIPTMSGGEKEDDTNTLMVDKLDESIVSISRQSEGDESMTDSEYGNVSKSEIDDCDRWSVLSTGPLDRQWTVVYTEKDEEL
ncbi:hypothetical protein L873DRAFT_1798692 [Choiromyces venosus 120613-1]|uniref:Uncharacterized protein n=1 Tax=Choiromyces venosus 120613-1 TaxID=1336337 RepID=A0A3N4K8S7_9PEZI|nr:hypothetical protein L873DRAFT_1798692 [Choiromyces venosus 120613-1]